MQHAGIADDRLESDGRTTMTLKITDERAALLTRIAELEVALKEVNLQNEIMAQDCLINPVVMD